MSLVNYDRYLTHNPRDFSVPRDEHDEELMMLDKQIEDLEQELKGANSDLLWYKNFSFQVRDVLSKYKNDPEVQEFLSQQVSIAVL